MDSAHILDSKATAAKYMCHLLWETPVLHQRGQSVCRELVSGTISVQIGDMLKNELEYEGIEDYYWTDSKVVLGPVQTPYFTWA